jgi:hypothetical protein
MFASLAERLRENGWSGIIPLQNPGKRPLPALIGWQRYGQTPPTDNEISYWARRYPGAGIGLVAGPDRVMALDVDFLDPQKARRALDVTSAILGPSPLERVGKPPKAMVFYRAASSLIVPGKAFGGYEIFCSTGQTVLYSVHPETRQPYRWTDASPEHFAPSDLPMVGQAGIDELLRELLPLREALPQKNGRNALSAAAQSGRTGALLAEINTRAGEKPAAIVRPHVEHAGPGDRYPTAFAGIVALVRVGLSDTEITAAVIDPYLAKFSESDLRPRRSAITSALRWARQEIGPDAATINAAVGADTMMSAWHAKWGR